MSGHDQAKLTTESIDTTAEERDAEDCLVSLDLLLLFRSWLTHDDEDPRFWITQTLNHLFFLEIYSR